MTFFAHHVTISYKQQKVINNIRSIVYVRFDSIKREESQVNLHSEFHLTTQHQIQENRLEWLQKLPGAIVYQTGKNVLPPLEISILHTTAAPRDVASFESSRHEEEAAGFNRIDVHLGILWWRPSERPRLGQRSCARQSREGWLIFAELVVGIGACTRAIDCKLRH